MRVISALRPSRHDQTHLANVHEGYHIAIVLRYKMKLVCAPPVVEFAQEVTHQTRIGCVCVCV